MTVVIETEISTLLASNDAFGQDPSLVQTLHILKIHFSKSYLNIILMFSSSAFNLATFKENPL
jgi:hypothetical protein